jgi:NADH-quinone oxidoreductase subunit J
MGVAAIFGGMLIYLIYNVGHSTFVTKSGSLFPPASKPANYSNTEELGAVLYTAYVYPFEIAAVILLVAIVAAIALTLRHRPTTKYQNPDQQVQVKRDDRLKVVKMDAEQKK